MANAAFGTPKRTTAMTPKRRMESAQLAEKRGLYWLSLADVAQLVEHFTRNEGVRGSSPRVGSPKSSAQAEFSFAGEPTLWRGGRTRVARASRISSSADAGSAPSSSSKTCP